MISINSNIAEITRTLTAIERTVLPQAISTSLNKTGRTIFKEVKRDTAKDTGLKQKEIAERMVLQKSNKKNFHVEIRMRGRWFNLIRFKARQFKTGVKAKAWGELKMYRSAFIGNKGRTVFTRETDSTGSKVGRLPIRALAGPNPVVELRKRMKVNSFNRGISKRFSEVFPRELAFRLRKLK